MSFMGVTPPISSAPPTSKEEQYDNELGTFLTLHRIAESDEGNRKRIRTVDLLLDIFKQWVTEVGLKRGVAEADCLDGAGARLFVFGSQRLGVHSPDADIDILCCAPQFASRYDFFLSFLDKINAMDNIINVLSLPDAYTPVIKFSLNNLSIDLVFVSLAMPQIPENIDILDNSNLKKLDEASIRSLNGVRVTEMIIKLVPNQKTFCIALRAIKCWATRRGIYANVLGFLGGVNYAILVAFVCQRYTQACPSTIIHQFFKIFSQWHWPVPVVLTNVVEVDNVDQTDMIRMPSWNPKLYPNDGYHLMPIITPAFPSMNSAFNVSIPQFRMIQLEIQRGLFLFETMENVPPSSNSYVAPESESESKSGSATVTMTTGEEEEEHVPQATSIRSSNVTSSNNSVSSFMPQCILWNTLFASAATDFFQLFPRYIQIDVTAHTAEGHRLWFGWCESRLRQLYVSIEQSQMVFCHPNANCFHRRIPISSPSPSDYHENINDNDEYIFSSSFFIGLSFPERTRSLDLTEVIQSFKYRVCSWVGKTAQMELQLKPLQGCDLPDFVYSEVSLPSNSNVTGCTPSKPARQEEEDRSDVSGSHNINSNINSISNDNSNDNDNDNIPSAFIQFPATPDGNNNNNMMQSVTLTEMGASVHSGDQKDALLQPPPPPSVPSSHDSNSSSSSSSDGATDVGSNLPLPLAHSGSTPTLAQLALNSHAKDKHKDTQKEKDKKDKDTQLVHNLEGSNPSESAVRIEKQLFSDDKRNSNIENSNNSNSNDDGDGNSDGLSSTPSSSAVAPMSVPPPSGQTRSPFKTTRKEFAKLTEKVAVVQSHSHSHGHHSDDLLSTSTSTSQASSGHDEHGSTEPSATATATTFLTSPLSDEEHEDIEEGLPCFSSPLKRVRPN